MLIVRKGMMFFLRTLADGNKELIYLEQMDKGGEETFGQNVRHLSYYVLLCPAMMIFCCRKGIFPIPLPAEILGRRKKRRLSRGAPPRRSTDRERHGACDQIDREVITRESSSVCFSLSHRTLSPSGNF
jgi:hypothetical protein